MNDEFNIRIRLFNAFLNVLEDYYQDNPPSKDAEEYNKAVATILVREAAKTFLQYNEEKQAALTGAENEV